MDKHDLYELCVQSPRHAVELLRAIHGGGPRVLAEDFCGSASVSRAWVADPGCRAIAADFDPDVLAEARRRAGDSAPIAFELRDVVRTPGAAGADIVFVGNFSIGEIHDRRELVSYLASARARLAPRGVFVCDIYCGESSLRLGAVTRRHAAPDGSIVHYTWEQAEIDPVTARVRNVLHFRVVRQGEVVLDLPGAFEYRWRLWSVAELRDAMLDAGFAGASIHQALDGTPAGSLDPAGAIACVAARCG